MRIEEAMMAYDTTKSVRKEARMAVKGKLERLGVLEEFVEAEDYDDFVSMLDDPYELYLKAREWYLFGLSDRMSSPEAHRRSFVVELMRSISEGTVAGRVMAVYLTGAWAVESGLVDLPAYDEFKEEFLELYDEDELAATVAAYTVLQDSWGIYYHKGIVRDLMLTDGWLRNAAAITAGLDLMAETLGLDVNLDPKDLADEGMRRPVVVKIGRRMVKYDGKRPVDGSELQLSRASPSDHPLTVGIGLRMGIRALLWVPLEEHYEASVSEYGRLYGITRELREALDAYPDETESAIGWAVGGLAESLSHYL